MIYENETLQNKQDPVFVVNSGSDKDFCDIINSILSNNLAELSEGLNNNNWQNNRLPAYIERCQASKANVEWFFEDTKIVFSSAIKDSGCGWVKYHEKTTKSVCHIPSNELDQQFILSLSPTKAKSRTEEELEETKSKNEVLEKIVRKVVTPNNPASQENNNQIIKVKDAQGADTPLNLSGLLGAMKNLNGNFINLGNGSKISLDELTKQLIPGSGMTEAQSFFNIVDFLLKQSNVNVKLTLPDNVGEVKIKSAAIVPGEPNNITITYEKDGKDASKKVEVTAVENTLTSNGLAVKLSLIHI